MMGEGEHPLQCNNCASYDEVELFIELTEQPIPLCIDCRLRALQTLIADNDASSRG